MPWIAFIEWARHQIEIFAEMFRKQVFGPDVDTHIVDDAIKVTHTQSRKVRRCHLCFCSSSIPTGVSQLLEEYGLDFRFLLEDLLVEKPPDSARRPTFKPHPQVHPDPIRTPASTPRSRSPAPNIAVPVPTRLRSPPPNVPPLPSSLFSPTSAASGQLSPAPSSPRIRSPIPRASSSASNGRPTTPTSARPGREMRGSPAPPPPRSRDRPGSSAGRPPPVAIPRRDGMF